MKCETTRSLFLEFDDGALSPDQLREVKEHLRECDLCRSEWEAYKKTLNEVSGMFPIVPPEDFTRRVKETIGNRSRGRFFNEPKSFNLSFAIVSFVLILLFALIYLYIFSGYKIEAVQPPEDEVTTPVGNEEGQSTREAPRQKSGSADL